MKFSERWLRTFVNPACSSEELAHILTMAGLEVESVTPVAPFFDNVVVAEIVSIQKHANADRLNVCLVDVGEASETCLQIVCGAQNVAVGMKTACALAGARLPELNIRKSKVRGIESFGMLCSAKELGLADEAEGLLDLPHEAQVGIDFREYYALDDRIFTLKLTPNRADCLGMYGVAREIAAITDTGFVLSDIVPVKDEIVDQVAIHVDQPAACPLYCGRVVRSVALDVPTPIWVTRCLERSGLRPVNPVVDVINYVMLETGQPMHAFDLDCIGSEAERALYVRYAQAQESLQLLNGEDLSLRENMLVIADANKPLALAGIMGGRESGVEQAKTIDIFLESAYFSPSVINGKSFELGFTSDSAHRFERGVDFSMTRHALERATAMIIDICGGKVGPVTELKHDLPQRDVVEVRLRRIEKILGVDLGIDLVSSYLRRLQFNFLVKEDVFCVTPPAYRFDLAIEEDFIEELARIHGYDQIPACLPKARMYMLPEPETGSTSIAQIRQIMTTRDYQEVINYAFVDKDWESDFSRNASPVALKNPIASHMSVMRSSLFGGLISNLQFNLNRKQSRVRIYEIGRCFLNEGSIRKEVEYVAGLCSGSALPEQWDVPEHDADFFDVKMDVETLLRSKHVRFEPAVHPALHPGKSAQILVNQRPSGWLGELHPRWLNKYHLPRTAVLFELRIDALAAETLPVMRVLSKYPPVRRDIAIVVDNDVSVHGLLEAMYAAKSAVISEIALFDLYSGEKLEPGKKSLAFRILLQDIEKTLTDQEIDLAVTSLVDVLGQKFGVTLRH
ncbi:phenylalanine--tRNA ligase subunit beta [Nitrosomonas halophila]|uniref:Phenylalanine--tRNA ligase beta subunit n=1 Tax=Nitrosomonas halophila TaxID=44576 RepID=A0A1H3NC19_9PROT|nr:phenylalanine--tRNA ligase subunit beta [Nitrosomonas halophila]SDY86418.1 phenylalanyl-tRNA synthetase beta chain [Nitrosomonas halophila]